MGPGTLSLGSAHHEQCGRGRADPEPSPHGLCCPRGLPQGHRRPHQEGSRTTESSSACRFCVVQRFTGLGVQGLLVPLEAGQSLHESPTPAGLSVLNGTARFHCPQAPSRTSSHTSFLPQSETRALIYMQKEQEGTERQVRKGAPWKTSPQTMPAPESCESNSWRSVT